MEDYIKEERTIILAVVSAKNDYANQIILKKCRQFDPKGARTLGVITKPDYLRAGSENESNWLGLAQNRDVVFELGWHMLKNRADDQVQWSTAQRNAEERAFFNAGNYRPVPQCAKGIAALRERLSKLLFDHLKRELPALKLELDDMTAQTTKELEALGKSRATPMDQRVYLTELFVSASNLVRMGVEGNYENAFFGQIDTKAAVDSLKNICRLRAVVQYLNMQFAQNMRSKGHRFLIEEDQETKPASKDTKASKLEGQAIINPAMLTKTITRKEAIKWVIQIMQRTRGRELPGTFNPMLVSSLFQDQSAHWEIIARRHINLVASSCCAFVLHVVSQLATPEVETKLLSLTVLPALKAAQKAALNELELLIEDKKRHPITYNHYFTDTLQRLQDARRMDKITEIAKNATVNVSQKSFSPGPGYENIDYINPDKFNKAIQSSMSRNMDEVAAEQALDAHDAYYKVLTQPKNLFMKN